MLKINLSTNKSNGRQHRLFLPVETEFSDYTLAADADKTDALIFLRSAIQRSELLPVGEEPFEGFLNASHIVHIEIEEAEDEE
jgi:hypothetical protein